MSPDKTKGYDYWMQYYFEEKRVIPSSDIIQSGEKRMKREFYVIVERDEDGYYVGEVPQLRACYSQGKTLDELMQNVREAITLCLEDEQEGEISEFIGLQKIVV